MPCYEMKSDLYFVSEKGVNVHLTDNRMEAAKKYAEITGRGKTAFVGVIVKASVSNGISDAYSIYSESDLLKLMTALVVGKDIEPPRPPELPKRQMKALKDMSIRDWAEKVGGTSDLHEVASYQGKRVYREVNLALVRHFTHNHQKRKESTGREIATVVYGCSADENIPKSVSNSIAPHLKFLEERGVISKVKRGVYKFNPQKQAELVRTTPKDWEEARKANVKLV